MNFHISFAIEGPGKQIPTVYFMRPTASIMMVNTTFTIVSPAIKPMTKALLCPTVRMFLWVGSPCRKGTDNSVGSLEAKIHTYAASVSTEGNGRNRQVGLSTDGPRIDQRTPCAQNGTAQYVPPVMSIRMDTSPGCIGRDGIGRNTPFPSVTSHQKSGTVEGYRCMRARKSVMTGAIGTVFLDSGFEGVVDSQSCGRTQTELPPTFAILLYQSFHQAGSRGNQAQNVGRPLYYRRLCAYRQRSQQEQERESQTFHLFLGFYQAEEQVVFTIDR